MCKCLDEVSNKVGNMIGVDSGIAGGPSGPESPTRVIYTLMVKPNKRGGARRVLMNYCPICGDSFAAKKPQPVVRPSRLPAPPPLERVHENGKKGGAK